MLNRRLVRIQVFQVLYAHLTAALAALNDSNAPTSDNGNQPVPIDTPDLLKASDSLLSRALEWSLRADYLITELLFALRAAQSRQNTLRKQRHLATEEDLNPPSRFVDNSLLLALANDASYRGYVRSQLVAWPADDPLIRTLLKSLQKTTLYLEYENNPSVDWNADRAFLTQLAEWLLDQEALYQWANESQQTPFLPTLLDTAISDVARLLAAYEPGGRCPFPPRVDPELEAFGHELLVKVCRSYNDNLVLLARLLERWDTRRIALADMLCIQMGFTELTGFEDIPPRVTLNEYIELVRLFGSSQSPAFVNGLLDAALRELRANGQLNKRGRGLRGEVGGSE